MHGVRKRKDLIKKEELHQLLNQLCFSLVSKWIEDMEWRASSLFEKPSDFTPSKCLIAGKRMSSRQKHALKNNESQNFLEIALLMGNTT